MLSSSLSLLLDLGRFCCLSFPDEEAGVEAEARGGSSSSLSTASNSCLSTMSSSDSSCSVSQIRYSVMSWAFT